MRQNQVDTILLKYGIDHRVMNAYPIFDDRIPEDYKVDAIDNQKLTFQIEKERMNQLSKTGVPAN